MILHSLGENCNSMTVERDNLGFDAPAPLDHPARASLPRGAYAGPTVGERLPDFELPDAFGRPVSFHADRGKHKAALVFYRSAVW
jgi:hypothetical protein